MWADDGLDWYSWLIKIDAQVTLSVFIKNVNADNLKVDIAQRSVRSDRFCGKLHRADCTRR